MDFDRKFDHREPDFAVSLETVQAALPQLALRSMTKLGGGYCNANYALEPADGEPLVLRIARAGAGSLATECALLRHLRAHLPVPELLHENLEGGPLGRPHALLSLLPGQPLCRVEDDLPPSAIADIARDVGTLAACVHDQRFGGSGFFAVTPGGTLTLEDVLPSIRGPYEGLYRACLTSPVLQQRLGPELTDALAACLSRHADRVWQGLPQARLTHSDFNQKNMLVAERHGRWTVTGLLDWEFAHAGSGLDDLGNFLRFSAEQPDYAPALAEAYRAEGGVLPDDWRFRTRYLDLFPMMQMLAREGIGQNTLATSRAVIVDNLRALA